jgi:hypothetical protein
MLAVASVIREMVRQKEEQQQAVAAGTQLTCFTGTRVQQKSSDAAAAGAAASWALAKATPAKNSTMQER